MQLTELLNNPGEHRFELPGLVGSLEAVLTVPQVTHTSLVAFLGHPHSLYGGSITNKVVTTMAKAFKDLHIPSLRFNFRGVGDSEGTYNEGIGESKDMLHLVQQWKKHYPQSGFIFAGFSFGSYVAYRTAAQTESQLLITVAPPVHHFNYKEFNPTPHPWVILQGNEDEVVPRTLVDAFSQECLPPLPVVHFAETTHFFHGKLLELKAQLIKTISEQLHLS